MAPTPGRRFAPPGTVRTADERARTPVAFSVEKGPSRPPSREPVLVAASSKRLRHGEAGYCEPERAGSPFPLTGCFAAVRPWTEVFLAVRATRFTRPAVPREWGPFSVSARFDLLCWGDNERHPLLDVIETKGVMLSRFLERRTERHERLSSRSACAESVSCEKCAKRGGQFELNLHPDDQFTLREPATRQVGTDRTRYGMGVRGLGNRPADPDDMGAGPTGGGAGTRPRPSLEAGRTRFEDPTRLQWAEAQLVGLRQRGRPAKEYIREFQKLAGRLRSWPDRLLVHHFRNGLDNEIRRACIVRGIGGRLSDWFKAAMELDIGLREHTSGRENRLPPRRGQGPPTGRMVQATPEATRPKTTFRCFRCNRPGHRAAECGLPAILGTPTAIGKPGSTPQKTTEKSRVAHQTGQTPIQPASGDHSPVLQEYEEDGPVEDSMGIPW
ncbi:Retrotransposon-derived protein PEG10 [Crotalus adamanteus]|uniref:Retrotransposon-derived protein PEG10 n=1 Tax=Crotalus adamanteus TaxID=8729 RepID=A0AAW1C7X3_CROAD